MTRPTTPRGLKGRGGKVWRELHELFEFDAHEVPLVLEACRVVTRIDELGAAVVEHGVMVRGSTGQLVVNPAIAEQRQQQLALSRLLKQLGLDEAVEGGAVPSARRSEAARAAAQARWNRPRGMQHG